MSLDYLLFVQAHYYSNPDKRPQPEYEPAEVDQLIWSKQEKISELEDKRRDKDFDECMYSYGFKNCSCCKEYLRFKKFDLDCSKATGYRSHCKECRKPVPF